MVPQAPQRSRPQESRKVTWKKWYYYHPDTGRQCDRKHRIYHLSDCKGKVYRFKPRSNAEEKDESKTERKRRGGKLEKSVNKKRALKLKKSLEAATTNISEESESESESDEE